MAEITVRKDGAIAIVELNRPAAGNALSGTLVRELRQAVRHLPGSGARAMVLTGAGKHFCTGADLRELEAAVKAGHEASLQEAAELGALYALLLRAPVLTVAAVEGAAYGGGAGLAAACDIVIAGPTARFQFSELRLGFVPALISVFLPRRIPPARLARLFLDPAPLDADSAVAFGLADTSAPDPLAAAVERCRAIARTTAPSAVAATKNLLLELTLPQLDSQLELAARVNAEQRAHPECLRGVAEFLATRRFADWLES